MPHESFKADLVRIAHMLDAANEALDFSNGRARGDLETNAMFRRAVINCLQEIGEAAVRVSPETRKAIPDLPWIQIIRMRNRLVHAYFATNLDLVWNVLLTDLKPMVE